MSEHERWYLDTYAEQAGKLHGFIREVGYWTARGHYGALAASSLPWPTLAGHCPVSDAWCDAFGGQPGPRA
jgi:hypothetical protein